jgi:MTH538 TIR-like domain (DUF1863).
MSEQPADSSLHVTPKNPKNSEGPEKMKRPPNSLIKAGGSLWTRLFMLFDAPFRYLFGRDVFVSYSRADASKYAPQLANAVRSEIPAISFYLDRWSAPPSSKLPQMLKRHLRWSSLLVLVCTEKAVQSSFVREEISRFVKTNRQIIPIIVGEAGDKINWKESPWKDIVGAAREYEAKERVDAGKPSDEIIDRIKNSARFTIQDTRLRNAVRGTLIGIALLIGIAFGISSFIVGRAQTQAANRITAAQAKERDASIKAAAAEERSVNANLRATDAEKRAVNANLNATAAENKAINANLRAGQAESQRKRAESDLITARKKTKEVEDLAKEQELKSRSNLARNYYNIAQTEARSNSTQALPWAQQAVATAPETDPRLKLYKLRALNLIKDIPRLIINPPGGMGQIALSPQEDKAITVSDSNYVAVWNLKTGEELINPLSQCRCVIVGDLGNSLVFSPDGKWIAAVTRELNDADNRATIEVHIHIWEAETGREQSNIEDARLVDNQTFIAVPQNFRFTPDSKAVMLEVVNQPDNLRRLLVWDIYRGEKLNAIESDHLFSAKSSNQESAGLGEDYEYEFPLSHNAQRNWIITFKEREAGIIAEVRDIYTGAVKLALPPTKILEAISFTGPAGKVVTIARDSEASPRMIRAWNIESGVEVEAARFTTSIAQEFKIIGLANDDNRLIVHAGNISIDMWLIDQFHSQSVAEYWGSASNLRAFITTDEKFMVTTANALGSNREFETRLYDLKTRAPVFSRTSGRPIEVSKSAETFFDMTGEALSVFRLKKHADISSTAGKDIALGSGDCLFHATKTPDQTAILTFYYSPCLPNPPYSRQPVNVKMQLWEISTGQPRWNPEGVALTIFVRDTARRETPLVKAVIDDEGKRLVTVLREAPPPETLGTPKEPGLPEGAGFNFSGPLDSSVPAVPVEATPRSVLAAWQIANGQPVPGFNPFTGEIRDVSFSADGLKLITLEQSGSVNSQVAFRAAATGSLLAGIAPVEFNKPEEGQAVALAENGEYMVLLPFGQQQNWAFNEIRIRRTFGNESVTRIRFDDKNSAALALNILKRAKHITLPTTKHLRAAFPSGSVIDIDASGNLFLLSENGSQTLLTAPDIKYLFEDVKISADGSFILKGSGFELSLWDAETGRPVFENISARESDFVYFDMEPSNEAVLTMTSNGQVRRWPIGSAKSGEPSWLKGMSEALSGTEIINDTNLRPIPQNKYLELRRAYMEKLQLAASQGDTEAQFVLDNWKP